MILKASQRGGAGQLAAHLLKSENEQVELHEVRGFMADDVRGAFKEAQAVAIGTRCRQFLFSLSLNPPYGEAVGIDAFEAAIDRIEERTGLTGQPRVVIFHEKEGRRHAHCVWSRIDAETMTARPLSFFKTKLREVSKALYLEHGWQMPRGLIDSKERDPRNFSLAEWQSAKRAGRDPAALKAAVQECWAASDNGPAFSAALEACGLYLARGDRRGHVAVTYEGEVVAVARLLGKRAKEVAARLGDPSNTRSVADARAHIAAVVVPRLGELLSRADQAYRRGLGPLAAKRSAMRDNQRAERERFDNMQQQRASGEAKARNDRLRRGVAGLWDRVTGRRAETIRRNLAETAHCDQRDRAERGSLVAGQLNDRRELQKSIIAVRAGHAARVQELHRDLAVQRSGERAKPGLQEDFSRASTSLRRTETGRSARGRDGPRGPRKRDPGLDR